MYDCARCKVFACENNLKKQEPDNCPMKNQEIVEASKAEYMKEENNAFFVAAAEVEAEGYCEWNRVRETIEFCKKMGYTEIGLACCTGFVKEAKILIRLFEERGLHIHSVVCKNGGIGKEELGVPKEALMHGEWDAACNPIGQAMYLAEEGVQFIIVMGLCVGHDSLFYKYISKYSDAFCTTIAVKDRATGNNPCAALYCAGGYFKNQFGD